MSIAKFRSKKFSISLFVAIVILSGVPGGVYAYDQYKYKDLINQAEISTNNDQFDQAISLFNSSLNYSRNSRAEVMKRIDYVTRLKESKAFYDEGIKKYQAKLYLEAIDMFNKVKDEDKNRYSLAKSKAAECKNLYVSTTIQNAKDKASMKEYDAALAILEDILKIDSSNAEALSLKKDFTVEKDKEAKATEDKAAAVLPINKTTGSTSSSTTPQTATPVVTQPKTTAPVVTRGSGYLNISDNGYKYCVQFFQERTGFPGTISYSVTCVPSRESGAPVITLDYTAVFHLGGDTTVQGKTTPSPSFKEIHVDTGNQTTGTVDITVTYKGKQYSFSAGVDVS